MRSALDDSYNTRLWSPGYEATMARLVARGQSVRADPAFRRDIAWGSGPYGRLDFAAPSAASGTLAVFVHGGYWQYRGAGKDTGSFLAPSFLSRGCAFAALTYDLCPDVTMGAIVEQVRRAVSWLAHDPAGRLGFRPERLVLIGHSAGAHLAAMTALAPERTAPIAAVCGVSGLYDLRPLVRTYLNGALRLDPDTAWHHSPLRSIRRDAPPFLLAVGEKESPAFEAQTRDFAAACRSVAVDATAHILPGRDHYDAIEDIAEPGSELGTGILGLATVRT
jgi:arylformamidase